MLSLSTHHAVEAEVSQPEHAAVVMIEKERSSENDGWNKREG